MKNKFILIGLILILSACEGDPGPMGPQGPPGINILGQVFEVTVNFTPNNGYSNLISFPSNIEVFESDVVMVYLLEEQVSDPSGPVDVWTPLPQTFYLNNGSELVYTYNHTFFDVNIFLDGNANLNTIPLDFIQNQSFRIAILPADFANDPNLDIHDFSSVQEKLQNSHENFKIEKIN